MNKKIIVGVLVVCLLVFVAVMAFAQNSSNNRWEYRVLTLDGQIDHSEYRNEFIQKANALGQEGWELIESNCWSFIFKRRI